MFAEDERGNRRSKLGDPLVGLTNHVDFVALANEIDLALPRPSRAKGGRPPYRTVLMAKILVLQQLYNLADDALEYQLLDRRSFLQFLGLTESSTICEDDLAVPGSPGASWAGRQAVRTSATTITGAWLPCTLRSNR
ncbi:transposase [Undibacterium arcticum]|uniref:transposase n=1 Tax=Undibacterium arcticum TaxID=1762892 RepID=UPI003606071D